MAAMTPQPIAMLETAFTGRANPPATAAIRATAMSSATVRCSGRLRYGSAIPATATVTASCVTG